MGKYCATSDVKCTVGDKQSPQCAGLTSNVLPKVQESNKPMNSQTGVSTNSPLTATNADHSDKSQNAPHWYALRVTYGREEKAYDYLVSKNVEAFYPTIDTVKVVDGKRKVIKESRFPNIFFARGTENEIKAFVYDNVNLPYLRFYYRHLHDGSRITKRPLIIQDYQIESLKIICASEAEDVLLVPSDVKKFKVGQTVRVIEGAFTGVIGKVARYHGQQRVAIIIDGLLTIASAYVPSAFLEEII